MYNYNNHLQRLIDLCVSEFELIDMQINNSKSDRMGIRPRCKICRSFYVNSQITFGMEAEN